MLANVSEFVWWFRWNTYQGFVFNNLPDFTHRIQKASAACSQEGHKSMHAGLG
jgi:hypothetical protein